MKHPYPVRLFGLLILLCIPLVAIGLGGAPLIFINLPACLLVGGGLFGFMLLTRPLDQAMDALRVLFTLAPSAHPSLIAGWFALASRAVLGLGLMGFLIGLINMLANLDHPSSIGPAMAGSLLSVLYAVGLSELLLQPLRALCLKQQLAPGEPDPERGYALLLVLAVTLAACCLVFVGMGPFLK